MSAVAGASVHGRACAARDVGAEERAQATVELAVALPVLIVLALIVYNVMLFAAAAARFDRMAPNVVLAQAVSPAGDEGDAEGVSDTASVVAVELERAMEGYPVTVEVSRDADADEGSGTLLSLVGALHTYRCTMRYEPWPRALSIAGVRLGAPDALVHERAVTIDPWRPGVVV